MHRFYWIDEGTLAGSSRPGASAELREDLAFLQSQGIEAVLTLTETPLDPWALEDRQLTSLHVPIADMTAPQPVTFRRLWRSSTSRERLGRAVVVHCLAGQGRAGSILAAWLIRRGSTAQEALAHLREVCPGAVENDEQEAALEVFARSRAWMV